MSTQTSLLQCSAARALIPMTTIEALVSAPALISPTAAATPTIGASAVTLSKQTVDGKDSVVSDIILAPGGGTGWHLAFIDSTARVSDDSAATVSGHAPSQTNTAGR